MISAVNGAGKLFMGRMLVFDPLPLILYYSIMQWLKRPKYKTPNSETTRRKCG